jgi:hypothetical protein
MYIHSFALGVIQGYVFVLECVTCTEDSRRTGCVFRRKGVWVGEAYAP